MGQRANSFFLCDDCLGIIFARAPGAEERNPTMSEKDMRREVRLQRAHDRLGTEYPHCACCLETDPHCLELHHLEGKDYGKTLINLCANCHRKLSDAQKDQTATLGEPPVTLERIGRFLHGLADLLMLIADKLWEFGEYLIAQARPAPQ
jgi:hypothetical protein